MINNFKNNLTKCHLPLIKKQFLVKKLEQVSSEFNLYKTTINSIFNEPSDYFKENFLGCQIVIGRKYSHPNIINNSNTLSTHTSKKNQRKSINQRVRPSSSRKGSFIKTRNSFFIGDSKYQYIDDKELKKIYEDFRKIQQNNSTLSNANQTPFYSTEPMVKNEMGTIFYLQQNTLKQQIENEKGQNKIKDLISKKLKISKSELLIERSSNYRVKKEVINGLEEEIKKNNDLSNNKWNLSLRYDPKNENKYYINLGSIKYPKWNVFIRKPPKINEIIRNPNKERLTEKTREEKEIESYLNKSYLKTKVPSYEKIKRQANGFRNLEVKGRDLLDFEMENSKMLKGKKMICLSNLELEEGMKKTMVISKNMDLCSLVKSKKIMKKENIE